MKRGARLLLVSLLLVGHALLGIGFSATYPASSHPGYYPGASDLAGDYEAFVGDSVELSGTVATTDPVTIEVSSVRLTVSPDWGTSALVPGDRLELFGVVEPDRTIRPVAVVRYPQDQLQRTYAISFVAGILVLFRLLRHWRLDGRRLVLRPRRYAKDRAAPDRAGSDP